MSNENWFILIALIALLFLWYFTTDTNDISFDKDNYNNQTTTGAPQNLAQQLANNVKSTLGSPTSSIYGASSTFQSPYLTPAVGATLSDTSQWTHSGELSSTQTRVTPQSDIPTAVNRVPQIGPFGITTGNPLDDTPIIFTENDVVALWSKSARNYLCFVSPDKAIEGPAVTAEYDLVLQATVSNPIPEKSAQWIVRQGLSLDKFPNSIRLENVQYPGKFLKAFKYKEGTMITQSSGGWQAGLGRTTQSNLYSTMADHLVLDNNKDKNSLVLWSSLMGMEEKEKLTPKSNVFLAVNNTGAILHPDNVASITDMSWERHTLGRQTVEGKIVYTTGSLAQLQAASRIGSGSGNSNSQDMLMINQNAAGQGQVRNR
jgi:hypothetical protein